MARQGYRVPIRTRCGVKRGGDVHRASGISRGVKRGICGVNRRDSGLSRGVKRQTQLVRINYLATRAALNPTLDLARANTAGLAALGAWQ
jgi:hypothetical protein